MSFKSEVADIMKEKGRVYEIAEKVKGKCTLTNEDKEIASVIDEWAKEIGRTGHDNNREIAQLILKTIEDPISEGLDEVIDLMFDRDTIGEFDSYEIEKTPKNTLIAHEAAKGGNVDKSYIDGSILVPTWTHAQVETELTYGQLRRNGFKSIAQATVFAKEALENKKIKDAFSAIDAAITGGDQVIAVTGAAPSLTDMDKLALYCLDMVESGDTPFTFGLNKYAMAIAKMSGYSSYMSDNMKESYNKYGLVKEYLGMLIAGFSGQKKLGDGSLIVPDKRIFGIAGKIGTICDRGELRVLETMDNNNEKVSLKFTGYEYGIKIDRPEKVAKITFTA